MPSKSFQGWICKGVAKDGQQHPNQNPPGSHEPYENFGDDCVRCHLKKEQVEGRSSQLPVKVIAGVVMAGILGAIGFAAYNAMFPKPCPTGQQNRNGSCVVINPTPVPSPGQTDNKLIVSPNPTVNPSSPDEVPLRSERNVDYTQLREYLRQKDWKNADRETYLRMLDAAGPKAQAIGMTPQDEMDRFSCTDLKTINQLWSTASNSQQGFTIQMSILKALGDNYRQMYNKVGWQELPPSNKWLFEWTYNTQTKRMEFVQGKEPNYTNPPPGHLPTVEIHYNYGVALSGALRRCNF